MMVVDSGAGGGGCCPIGRGSRVGSELEQVRIKGGHGSPLLLGLCRIRGGGGDKAPLPRTVKAATRLMPDSHIACVNPDQAGHCRLTGFRKTSGEAIPSPNGT